ncbi:hypothetical protein IHE45_05G229100 [Dioscorea alata]|uniref:Uncharacterized protein n=1 Tax=Dioscorea alata TaxID=55571 RepID=A0ACB7W9D2_DIOAL|nr:hypothetical protein IHE45_05G229100 [Dioscorea alata]
MVKQKMVMKLTMEDAKKRSKALKTAVSFSGVISAGLEGEAKDRLVVIGEGVDSISLTIILRKKMGHVELVSVSSYDEKKDGKKENNNNIKNKSKGEDTKYVLPYQYHFVSQPYMHGCYDNRYDPSCSLL